MSGGYPALGSVCNAQGSAPASEAGIAIATGAANTMGAWTTLISSTPADCVLALIQIQTVNAGTFAVSIGRGAAGSEIAIISDIVCATTNSSAGTGTASVVLPLMIPAGTRISAQAQSNVATQTVYVGIILLDGSFEMEGVAGYDTIGFTPSTTKGTAIAATSTSKGAYSPLITSTAKDYCGFFLCPDYQGATSQFGAIDFDVAIGAAGLERIILPDICIGSVGNYGYFLPIIGFSPIQIAAGTRIAARAAASNPTFSFGLTLYGAYK